MNQVTKRSPFKGLSELHQALDRMFESSWLERESLLNDEVITNWIPTLDVKEEENQYIISADVPGVEPKNIDISINKGILTIKGHKETETKDKQGNYVHIERSQGSFYRSLYLPNATDTSKVIAKSKNGVIKITIPKTKGNLSQKIPVEEE